MSVKTNVGFHPTQILSENGGTDPYVAKTGEEMDEERKQQVS